MKNIIGSQIVPYIYEDKITKEDFIAALKKVYNMSKEERNALGAAGRDYVLKNYSQAATVQMWDELMTDIYNNLGSWGTRTNHKNWELIEVAA